MATAKNVVINIKYAEFEEEEHNNVDEIPSRSDLKYEDSTKEVVPASNLKNSGGEKKLSHKNKNKELKPARRSSLMEGKLSYGGKRELQNERKVSFGDHSIHKEPRKPSPQRNELFPPRQNDSQADSFQGRSIPLNKHDRKISERAERKISIRKTSEREKEEADRKVSERKISGRKISERKVSERGERKASVLPKISFDARKGSNLEGLDIQFGEERYRFVIIGLYCLSASLGAAFICTFAPITKTMEKVFKATPFEIYILTNLYLLCGAVMNFPLQVIVQKIGRRPSLILGMFLMASGSLLKVFLNSHIIYAIVGQTLCCVGFEFLHSLIGPITCYWFAPKSRVIVFAVATVAYSFGNFLGYLVPTSFVTEDHPSVEENKREVQTLHIFFMILSFIVFILVVIFFKEEPDQPLNHASLVERYEIAESVKILAKNSNYILVCVGMACLLSVQYARANSYYYLTQPFGFSQSQASYLSSIESWGEMCGLILISLIGNRFFKPKSILNIMPIYIFVIFGITIGAYNTGNFIGTAVVTFLMGMSMNAFPPYCEHYTIGVTFPIHENITIGSLYSGGLWGAMLSGALSVTVRNNSSSQVFIWVIYPFFFGLILIALAAFNKMKDINLRENYE
jgi:fucose permease